MGAWDDFADRLVIGPRSGVQEVMQGEYALQRERAKRRDEESDKWLDLTYLSPADRQAQYGTTSPRILRAEAPTRANVYGGIAAAARTASEKAAREQTEREGLAAELLRIKRSQLPTPEHQGPSIPLERILAHPKGEDLYKHLTPPPKEVGPEEGVSVDPTKPFVGKRSGRVIREATPGPVVTMPQPWQDYDPLRQIPSFETGKWELKHHSPNVQELITLQTGLLRKQREQGLTTAEQTGLADIKGNLATSLVREQAVAGHRAAGQYPYRPLSEDEQKALNWIEGLENFSQRFEQFSPEQLTAVTTLPGWLKAKGKTVLKGVLPQVFGAPGKAEQTYAAIESLMAEAEQMGFKLGGQQLTPMEKETVMAFVPNRGDLINPVTLAAKLGNLRQSLGIIKEMRMWRLNTPRGALSTETYDAALKKALEGAGIKSGGFTPPTQPIKDNQGRPIPGGVAR